MQLHPGGLAYHWHDRVHVSEMPDLPRVKQMAPLMHMKKIGLR
jgi:hypothetical protein